MSDLAVIRRPGLRPTRGDFRQGAALSRILAELPLRVADLVAHGSPAEIADARQDAECLAHLAEQIGASFELRQDANECWMQLEIRMGEILLDRLTRGRPKNGSRANHFRLADLRMGTSKAKKLSVRAQQMAAIPARARETYFRTARQAGWEITWSGPNGLQQRAAADFYELSRQRTRRAPEDFFFVPAGSPSGRARPLDRANDPAWKIRSPKQSFRPEVGVSSAPLTVDIRLGDCLKLLPEIPAHSCDVVLADLPYGQRRMAWDQPLDLTALFGEYLRVIRRNCPIVLFGAQPFTSRLVMSRPDLFKFDIIWIKNRPANFPRAYNEPLRFHESILVFSEGKLHTETRTKNKMPYYPRDVTVRPKGAESGYPRSYVNFDTETGYHPTQKPVPLLRYLIELFSRPGETVLDSCMGSGSAGLAAIQSGRSFIGFENHRPFFEIAKRRMTSTR